MASSDNVFFNFADPKICPFNLALFLLDFEPLTMISLTLKFLVRFFSQDGDRMTFFYDGCGWQYEEKGEFKEVKCWDCEVDCVGQILAVFLLD